MTALIQPRRGLIRMILLMLVSTLAAIHALSGSVSASTLSILHSFCQQDSCADGSTPSNDLARDAGGNLYGMVQSGGAYNAGTIYELSYDPASAQWNYTILYNFCPDEPFCADGYSPLGKLAIDVNGNLYGTAFAGGKSGYGLAFELIPNVARTTWKFKVLYNFCSKGNSGSCRDGVNPSSGLTYAGQATGALYDGSSPLYGSVEAGVLHGGGAVFELTPSGSTWNELAIYRFCKREDCADGEHPLGGLLIDSAGNLFGATTRHTPDDYEPVVFELSPDGRKYWKEIILHISCSWQDCADGFGANALVMDSRGRIFGAAFAGGQNDNGVLFTISPNSRNSRYKVLYTFCAQPNCTDGRAPESALTIGKGGDLYGTTLGGGANNAGTAFKYGRDGAYSVLQNFCAEPNCTDGAEPQAALLIDPAGNLMGTTPYGGDANAGVIFQLTP